MVARDTLWHNAGKSMVEMFIDCVKVKCVIYNKCSKLRQLMLMRAWLRRWSERLA